ncbi:MAG: aminomethyltransferase family protein, partial [Pseudomonadota bacterium]
AERIGWEVPMYYDKGGEEWVDDPSLRWKPWSDRVRDECLAARDATVLLDQSMYAKLLVQGPDAVHALNKVCSAQLDIAVGTSVYTPFINANGGIEADVTVTRLQNDQFLVVTGHPSQLRDQYWIRAHAAANWRFEVFDATSAYALFTVHGPNSRALLQSLSNDDLSNTALPFGAAREVDLGHARARLIRRSFLGELGYEILVSTEFCQGIYDELFKFGEAQGLVHMGMFAMNACRLEKGFRHFGHDIGEDDTPYEAGLGFAVDLDKHELMGRERLVAQSASGLSALTDRLACIRVPGLTAEQGPYLIHNEPMWRDGAIVGHVTSGDWGWRTGSMVGIAALSLANGVSLQWLEAGDFSVQIAGEFYPCDVQFKPFYDPRGERMRG